jgi:hypothetical protein
MFQERKYRGCTLKIVAYNKRKSRQLKKKKRQPTP